MLKFLEMCHRKGPPLTKPSEVVPKRRLEGLESLTPGQKMPRGETVFDCKVEGTKRAFGGFGGFDAWPKSATWQFRNGI